jgi:Na+/H+ antiporter NhaD/arsenite permease-like protein
MQITNGQIWPLIHCLCIITCAISMLLDNVTTVLLMAPITITLCEDLDLNPVPILMAIVVHANIGGCATPVSKIHISFSHSNSEFSYIHFKIIGWRSPKCHHHNKSNNHGTSESNIKFSRTFIIIIIIMV